MEEGKKPPAELARVDHDGIDLICRYGNLRAVFGNNPGDGNSRKGLTVPVAVPTICFIPIFLAARATEPTLPAYFGLHNIILMFLVLVFKDMILSPGKN
jgi:hypothetical protein